MQFDEPRPWAQTPEFAAPGPEDGSPKSPIGREHGYILRGTRNLPGILTDLYHRLFVAGVSASQR